MNTIFKRIQPIGAKGKFSRLCLSSCTGALHAKLCHAATPADWVEQNFDEVCTLIKRIHMMCTPRRGFQATLITCIFYLLWVSIIAGRWFFLKIQFIRSVCRQASLRNLTSMFNPNLRGILYDFAKHSRFLDMPSVACYRYQWQVLRLLSLYWVAKLVLPIKSAASFLSVRLNN